MKAFAPTSTAATKPSSAHFARGWAPSGASPRSSAFRAFPSTLFRSVREASLLYKLRSMAGSDVEGVALPVYRTMMAAARRFEAQSQEAGEAVSGTVTLRLRSPADFTAVTEIFAVHDYVPESLSWVNPVIVLSATKPLPASMVRDLREHGIRIEAQNA